MFKILNLLNFYQLSRVKFLMKSLNALKIFSRTNYVMSYELLKYCSFLEEDNLFCDVNKNVYSVFLKILFAEK